jgi:hypothetical protein
MLKPAAQAAALWSRGAHSAFYQLPLWMSQDHTQAPILFLSDFDSPRIRYVVQWLSDYWSVPVRWVNEADFLTSTASPRLHYAQTRIIDDAVFIQAGSHLINGAPPYRLSDVVNPEHAANAPFGFDVLAAMFCLLARTEEYLPFTPDSHDRFSAKSDSAYHLGYLQQPMADVWGKQLAQLLEKQYPRLVFHWPKPTSLPTFDIDMAFAYQARGFARNLYNKIRFLAYHKQWPTPHNDPYNRYAFIKHALQEQQSRWFWLVCRSNPPLDPAVDIEARLFRQTVQFCSQFADMGIHPSYNSLNNHEIISEEKSVLSRILGTDITHSRQHFLRFRLPTTYRMLLEAGITYDYSMGYADAVGFRAGTSRSFMWYDFENDCSTPLHIQPFALMDVTLKNYLHLSPQAAIDLVKQLRQTVFETHGCWSFVWHNTSFDKTSGWFGWEAVFWSVLEPYPSE